MLLQLLLLVCWVVCFDVLFGMKKFYFLILIFLLGACNNKIHSKNQIASQYNLIIYPGRFQPFHQGHYSMIKEAQKHGKHIVIAISQARNMQKDNRNIFSGDDREKMIRDTLDKDGFQKLSIIQLDYVGNGKTLQDWDNNLIQDAKSEYKKIFKVEPKKSDIAFIYYDRDKANYDKRFGQDFDIIEIRSSFDDDVSATKIRKEFFEECKIDEQLPVGTKGFLTNQEKKCKQKQKIQIAITFDDLPFADSGGVMNGRSRLQSMEKIINVAKKYNIPDLYGFVNGKKIKTTEDKRIIKLWEKEYQIANHTYSHMNLNKSSALDYQNDIAKNDKMLQKYTKKDYKYFRYSYLYEGDTLEKRNTIREFLKQNNYKIAQVTVDFEDWSMSKPFVQCYNKHNLDGLRKVKNHYLDNALTMLLRAEQLSKHLFKKPIKHILLLHASHLNAEFLEDLIKLYLQHNVEFVSLSDAVYDEAYSINYDKPFKEGREFVYQLAIANNVDLKKIGVAGEEAYYNWNTDVYRTLCE
jgi:cytidyltransferase-like protein